jgi:hypothetical protein
MRTGNDVEAATVLAVVLQVERALDDAEVGFPVEEEAGLLELSGVLVHVAVLRVVDARLGQVDEALSEQVA